MSPRAAGRSGTSGDAPVILRTDWVGTDPTLVGPYAGSDGAVAIPFDVPAAQPRGFHFGRIRSGDAWPNALARVDRIAAVPAILHDRIGSITPREQVALTFEASPGEATPLCARADAAWLWNVDPCAWIRGLLDEDYVSGWKRPITSRLPLVNYSRLPHWVKGLLERTDSPRAAPRNPIDFPTPPLDDLVEVIRKLCFALCFGAPPRLVDVWPEGRSAAAVLTHDVDTSWILSARRSRLLSRILDREVALGYRGAWYVTANRLHGPDHEAALACIRDAGHEVGSHGWNHDSKLAYLPVRRQTARMQRIRRRFGDPPVDGIRTPWYARSAQLGEVLARHFAYDSSVPNVSAFHSSASNSGCCSIFPYRTRGGLLELPMTLPPDTALDRSRGAEALAAIADRIVEAGGVVVSTFHPQPHQSANEHGLRGYFDFLEALAERHAGRLWHATPTELLRRYEAALRTTAANGAV